MSAKIEKTENNNEVKLEITIEAEKFDAAIKTVYIKNAKYFNVPGFRKGKVPFNIVEKTYGKEIFYEDAFNEVVPEIYEKALEENKIEAVSRPKIDIKQMEKGKELIFTAIVQTKPEVKLGEYKGIELEKVEYNVSDEQLADEINKIAEKNARIVSVEDREVKDGDIVVIDFEGFVDGKPFEGGKAENHELTIGSNTFIPGFETQIEGMKINEEREINVKFPDEYFSEDLSGKDAVFKIKLHEIKEKQLPEIDDEFAKDVSEFETLEELKNSIKEKKTLENEKKAKYETEENAIKKVCETVELDIPSGMIETEVDYMINDFKNSLAYQGMSIEMYLKYVGKTMEELRKDNEESAKESIKSRLVLEAICDDAKIKVTDKEKEEKLKELAEAYGKNADELKQNENVMKNLEKNLKMEKTLDYIMKNAKFTKTKSKK